MAHRITLWRWKTGRSTPRACQRQLGRRRCGRRDKDEQQALHRQDLGYVAALIEECQCSPVVDYRAVAVDLARRLRDDRAEKIQRRLIRIWKSGTPADLIKVACCDALRLGPRERRPSRSQANDYYWRPSQSRSAKLARRYDITVAEAEQLIANAGREGNWEWVAVAIGDSPSEQLMRKQTRLNRSERHKLGLAAGDDDSGDSADDEDDGFSAAPPLSGSSPVCVSKIFHNISRRLAWYYRRHPRHRKRFQDTLSILRDLASGSVNRSTQ
jgi:hypothetical protein